MRLQGYVQNDLTYHSANVFLAFQGLRYYKRRRVPPRNTVTQAVGRNHAVLRKKEPFTVLHTNSCREIARGRMFLPSVFPNINLLPQPFLEGNLHLQFLGCSNGPVQNIPQHHAQMEIDEKVCRLAHTCVTDVS